MIRSLQVLVGISLLAGLFFLIPASQFLEVVSQVSTTGLFLAFVISTLGMIISSLKLYIVLPQLGISVRFVNVLRAYYLGTFFNNFIPTSVGGDVIKTDVIRRSDGADLRTSSLAVLFERASGLILLGLIALTFLVATPYRYKGIWNELVVLSKNPNLGLLAGLFIGFVLFGSLIFVLKTSLFTAIRSYLKTFFAFPRHYPITVVNLFGLSLVFHGLKALCLIILTEAFGPTLFFLDALFILPIIAFTSFLPISFGGLGLRESVLTFCLHSLGISLEVAFAVSLAFRLVTTIHSVAGGIIYVLKPLNSFPSPSRKSIF